MPATDLRCPGCGAEYHTAATGEHAVVLAAKGCQLCGHKPLQVHAPSHTERVEDAIRQQRPEPRVWGSP